MLKKKKSKDASGHRRVKARDKSAEEPRDCGGAGGTAGGGTVPAEDQR